jgi:hypothetical protein
MAARLRPFEGLISPGNEAWGGVLAGYCRRPRWIAPFSGGVGLVTCRCTPRWVLPGSVIGFSKVLGPLEARLAYGLKLVSRHVIVVLYSSPLLPTPGKHYKF